MAGQLREYRGRIRSTQSMQKIFRAMELIATSRITRARAAVAASTPYADALTRAVSAVATHTESDHPLVNEVDQPRRAAVLVVTSDRGMAGAYSSTVLREGERLVNHLRERGLEVALYAAGRKAAQFYRFRRRDLAGEWSGSSESPTYDIAAEIGASLVEAFTTGASEGGVDEVHVVSTRFKSMVTQEPQTLRLLPLEVVEGVDAPEDGAILPLYAFEPDAEQVLDALLPRYVSARLFNLLLQAAASEHAARQRAMKAAGDNADDLIKNFTRLANQARQAEITQEITEIVSGADALASART